MDARVSWDEYFMNIARVVAAHETIIITGPAGDVGPMG